MSAWWVLLGEAWAGEPVADDLGVRLGGYVDVGWFDAAGDGVSYDSYPGYRPRPAAADPEAAWVFWGDPWANAVNSQGESADLGLDRNNLQRADDIASGGRPTFLLNRIEQSALLWVGPRLLVVTAIDADPRSGDHGDLGDVFSVDRGYIGWMPLPRAEVWLYAGKVESAFGTEWSWRRAPDRIGITPSLIARYTVGTPVGLELRGKALADHLRFAASLTNGGTTTERFGHASDELDSNGVPTGTARLAVRVEGPVRLEVGASGQAGAMDGQPDPRVPMTQVGADLLVEIRLLTVRAEALISDQDDHPPRTEDSLFARGGYLEVVARPLPRFAPVVRLDLRHAVLRSGPNLYLSDIARVTAGARFDLNVHLAAKVEYLHLVELAGAPTIDDDVTTASVVFHY